MSQNRKLDISQNFHFNSQTTLSLLSIHLNHIVNISKTHAEVFRQIDLKLLATNLPKAQSFEKTNNIDNLSISVMKNSRL